jgi:hypothetical protein
VEKIAISRVKMRKRVPKMRFIGAFIGWFLSGIEGNGCGVCEIGHVLPQPLHFFQDETTLSTSAFFKMELLSQPLPFSR